MRRIARFGRAGGFSALELLVVLAIAGILLAIFIPSVLKLREQSRRARCADNLRQIRDALGAYAADHSQAFPRARQDPARPAGYAAFSGADSPDAFAPDSRVLPNDVTASMWLLLKGRYLVSTSVFVCPSAGEVNDPLRDGEGQATSLANRANFRRPIYLSYAMASPFSAAAADFRWNRDLLPGAFVIMADAGPGDADSPPAPPRDAEVWRLAQANSPNHGHAGQNVLYIYGEVKFWPTPYCGVNQDNIYSALSASPRTPDAALPADSPGVRGRRIGPAWAGDGYLVPAAGELPSRP